MLGFRHSQTLRDRRSGQNRRQISFEAMEDRNLLSTTTTGTLTLPAPAPASPTTTVNVSQVIVRPFDIYLGSPSGNDGTRGFD